MRFYQRILSKCLFGICLSAGLLAPNVVAAQAWVYTALGDSLAFGALAPPFEGYVYRYRDEIAADTHATVPVFDLGVPGWKSGDLLDALRHNFVFRELVAASSIVTWDIGGNDLRSARQSYKNRTCGGTDNQDCLRSAVATFKANWDAILAEIMSLRNPAKTILRTMDIYNPYIADDRSADSWPDDDGLTDLQALKPYLDEVNAHIAATVASHSIPYAQVYLAFNGPSGEEDPRIKGYISVLDGLHPSKAGHRQMAELLRGLGYAPLFPGAF
jgi:lysophospholipase L1-like esterase